MLRPRQQLTVSAVITMGLLLTVACATGCPQRPTATSSPTGTTGAQRPAMPTGLGTAAATLPIALTNSVGIAMVRIEPGTFMMGNGPQGNATERDHTVQITRPYLIGVTEVTQAQWSAIMPENPSKARGDVLPVTNVSWEQASEYCRILSAREGRVYRLPTEAEWEHACRAGTTTSFSFGDSTELLGDFAWFNGNARGAVQPVATRRPNPWGLHDMHGNVREWCSDWFAWRYPTQPQIDPIGPATGTQRVRRGGTVGFYPSAATSGARDAAPPDLSWDDVGFRVVAEERTEASDLETPSEARSK